MKATKTGNYTYEMAERKHYVQRHHNHHAEQQQHGYTMNASCSLTGATAFTVTGTNVTLDCMGSSVTGNNSSATYGVYTTSSNHGEELHISNFATGNFFNGSTRAA